MYKEVTKCRICGNKNLVSIINLGNQYMTGIFPKDMDSALTCGPLELVKCMSEDGNEACGLVQLHHTYDLEEMYGETYGYRSGLNKSMVNHLSDKIKRIEGVIDIASDGVVLDIGSNDATLLKSYSNKNIKCYGVDPSAEKFRSFYTENIDLITEFFPSATLNEKLGNKKINVVTSIAMFYDLDAPLEFVQAIYDVIDDNGIWIFEQSYMPEMIKTHSYDTICHEHLEYYCLKQVKWMMDAVGFKIVDVEFNKINGGSFSVTVAKRKSEVHSENIQLVNQLLKTEVDEGYDSLTVYDSFVNDISESKERILSFLMDCKMQGKKVFGYGASTKGNVVLQYCGITADLLPYIAEVNSDKFGAYTPGSNIPIVSEKEAREMKPDYFFVLPWHFKDNILGKERTYMAKEDVKFVFPLPQFDIVS
jgi:NDP-4-keto-2,6-dideoxyhexose 3-C-methyltransferase